MATVKFKGQILQIRIIKERWFHRFYDEIKKIFLIRFFPETRYILIGRVNVFAEIQMTFKGKLFIPGTVEQLDIVTEWDTIDAP